MFVHNGVSNEESIILNSIKESIARFFAHFAGPISEYKDGWKDFTVKDSVTNENNFSENKFCTPTMHLLEFQKHFSKIQLIASYFEEKKYSTGMKNFVRHNLLPTGYILIGGKVTKCFSDLK